MEQGRENRERGTEKREQGTRKRKKEHGEQIAGKRGTGNGK